MSQIPALRCRLSCCVDDLSKYFASLRLQLNSSKTDFIWFGTKSNLAKIQPPHKSLSVCSSVVSCSEVVRDLGVFLDSELSTKKHVSNVASVCFYHLRRLRQLRNCVSQSLMAQLVTSLVISRLDSCNSALAGLPISTIAPLQRVQNAAARLVLGLD